MEKIIFKTGIVLLLLFVTCTGCGKEQQENEVLWEISPDSKNTVIQDDINGIEFKFCLLNEEGKPATKFKEGGNFTFYFSSINKRTEKLNFDPSFADVMGNDFCKVFNLNNQDVGKPFIFRGYNKIGAGAYPFAPEQVYVFEQQWIDNRDEWSTLHWFFENARRSYLPKGRYYTQFTHKFRFARTIDEPSLYIGPLTFKINFEIE